MNEWIAASRAFRVRALLPRTVSRWSRKSSTSGASKSASWSAEGGLPARSPAKPSSSSNASPGLDGAGAGAALGGQAPQEEVLHELAEPDLRRSHDTPAGGCAAKPSNRPAMMLSSSGTADMYQYTSRTSTWPR